MKKIITILLSVALCACVFCSCSKNNADEQKESVILQPTEAVDIENLQADEDFAGDYKNDTYTAHVEKNENDEMVITITDAEQQTQWTMSGYFGYETYRVNYDNAVKTVSGGKQTEYENGAGRIQFNDSNHFRWDNSMEIIEHSEFERASE